MKVEPAEPGSCRKMANGSSSSREVVVSSRLLMLGLETTSVKRVVMEYFAGLKDHRV